MSATRLIRLLAPALFLGATAVFPALHQAFHGHDHDHEGGTIRFHRHGKSHGHGAAHRHGNGSEHTHETPAPPGRSDDSDPRHGEGSLAHFSCALGEGSPSPVAEVSKLLEAPRSQAAPDDPDIQPGYFRAASVRGPPAVASRA